VASQVTLLINQVGEGGDEGRKGVCSNGHLPGLHIIPTASSSLPLLPQGHVTREFVPVLLWVVSALVSQQFSFQGAGTTPGDQSRAPSNTVLYYKKTPRHGQSSVQNEPK
jgi:hypothetical protein